MPARARRGRDTLEPAIEAALRPGRFVSYAASSGFVSGLEKEAKRVREVEEGDPARAVALYETFLAGCYEKAGEVDDSDGDLGQFAADLHCAWIRAREAAGAAADETAERVLRWMDDDPYGFCHRLEGEAVEALGKEGLAALERRVRARFDAGAAAGGEPPADPKASYARRRQGEVLRAILAKRRDPAAYGALCEATGTSPEDCLQMAKLLQAKRRPEEALAWAERGLGQVEKDPLGRGRAFELSSLRLTLLRRVGRGGMALDEAWAGFREFPATHTYAELMRLVPRAERVTWHEKAMEEALKSDDLGSLVDLLMAKKETESLARRLRAAGDRDLEALSHFTGEPAARRLSRSHPDVAARMYRALGMRILHGKKSKYYAAALGHFERARDCYGHAGPGDGWESVVAEVRAAHGRKVGFMPGFERLLAGHGPSREPSFLDRARGRWVRGEAGANPGEAE